MTVTGTEGEYQNALVSHGTVDFANRSMLADSKGRAGTLRLSFSGNQNTMTSTLRPHVSQLLPCPLFQIQGDALTIWLSAIVITKGCS
jgi:hypothetical protein